MYIGTYSVIVWDQIDWILTTVSLIIFTFFTYTVGGREDSDSDSDTFIWYNSAKVNMDWLRGREIVIERQREREKEIYM